VGVLVPRYTLPLGADPNPGLRRGYALALGALPDPNPSPNLGLGLALALALTLAVAVARAPTRCAAARPARRALYLPHISPISPLYLA